MDGAGRIFLLTSNFGVLVRSGASWIRKTPSWSEFEYASALGVDGQRAIIGTADHGALLWDFKTDTARQITFPHSASLERR